MLPSDENSRILRIESKDSEPMLKKRRRSCFWAQRTQWCRLFFWQTDNKLFQKKNDQKTILPYGEKTLRNHTFVCSGPGTRASFSSAFANTGSRRERKLFVYFWASLVIPSYQQTVAMIASLCMIFHQHLLKYNGWLWFSIVVYRCVHVCHCASYCNISNIFKYVLQLYHGN